jgi:hypothetical protein
VLPGVSGPRPARWIVCEDGREYLERFVRFLGGEFEFGHALDGEALLGRLGEGPAGVILDLDFRRTPPERLVDEAGRSGAAPPEGRRRALAESQGVLILRLLRARGHGAPVILFADFDDPGQAAFLEETLGPLSIAPSHEGILETAERMRRALPGPGTPG